MCDKSLNIITILRKNESINKQTIDSLINYGFDSNETLNALDFESDLPKIKGISNQQKTHLIEVLTQFKIDFNCVSNNLITNSEFNELKDKFPVLSELYENEIKSKQITERQLEEEVKRLERRIDSIKRLFKTNFNQNLNQIKETKNAFRDQLDRSSGEKSSEEEVVSTPNTSEVKDCFVKLVKLSQNDINGYKSLKMDLTEDLNTEDIEKYIKRTDEEFKCVYKKCFKQFYKSRDIKVHIKRHLEIKPFKCEDKNCGKSFVNIGALNHHQKVCHLLSSAEARPESKNKCKYCGISFARSDQMFEHRKSHFGLNPKPFKCQQKWCSYKSVNKWELKQHILNNH